MSLKYIFFQSSCPLSDKIRRLRILEKKYTQLQQVKKAICSVQLMTFSPSRINLASAITVPLQHQESSYFEDF